MLLNLVELEELVEVAGLPDLVEPLGWLDLVELFEKFHTFKNAFRT